jgi:hypothetical protein
MGDNGHRSTSLTASSQLARKYYNVDSTSNDDGSDDDNSDCSSLLILSPIRNNNLKHGEKNTEKNFKNGTGSHNSFDSKKKPPPGGGTKSGVKLSKNTKTVSGCNGPTNFSISSDSESEDDDMFLSKSKRVFEKSKPQRVFEKEKPNEGQKQRKKREREAQKEKEKQHRTQIRKEAKNEKERRKQEEKMTKKQQNEEYNQTMGKYRHEEVAVLLDTGLCKDDPHGLVEALSADFLVHPYQSRLAEGLPSSVTLIQYIRKDKLLGGAKEAVESLEADRVRGKTKSNDDQGYEHIQYLLVLFEPDDFIPLLHRDAQKEEDDYPALECWLDGIRSRWQRAWSSAAAEPKIIFLLVGLPEALDKKWIDYRRHHRKSSRNEASLPTVKELQDAMQWVLVQFQVECILCPNTEFLQSTVHKMTRGLSDRPYIKQATELECIKKIKQGCARSSDPLEKAKDIWLRQLQQLTGLSENKAQHVVEHFPTCQTLWQAYQWEHHRQQDDQDGGNNADALCSALLESKFSADNKRYKKLSDSLYRVLTSNDPYEMIL